MVADFYIFWAYLYDVADNFEKAEYVFQKGRDAKAEPREALELAHNQFGFSMSQRLLHKDKYREGFMSTMEQRRNALTSLRTHRGHQVGSVRIGSAIKSHAPGRVDQHHRPGLGNQASISNERVSVFVDGARGYHPAPHAVAPKSIVQLIMDSSRKQENLREPGPWSKAGAKQSTTMFARSQNSAPSFPILEDMEVDFVERLDLIPMSIRENNYSKPISLPAGFVSRNESLTPFPTAFFIEEPIVPNSYSAYDKCMVFPKPDKSFSIEELGAYRWFKKRGICNAFTDEQDLVWSNEPSVGIRLYPQFAANNDPQEEWITERFIPDDFNGKARFSFDITMIYPQDSNEELTLEDILFAKFQKGEMAFQQMPPDPEPELEQTLFAASSMDLMDETMPVQGRQSIARGAIRKSVVPGGRKSIFPMPEERSRKSIVTIPVCLPIQPLIATKRIEEPLKSLQSLDREIHPIVEEESSPENVPTSCTTARVDPNPALKPSLPFVIFEDVKVTQTMTNTVEPAVCKAAVVDQPPIKSTSPFVIFEDSEPLKVKEKHVFKTPIAPSECPPPRLALVNKVLPREPEEPALEPEEAAGGATIGSNLNPNETCFSTQQFMFFIKAQSVSTPKANKQRKDNIDTSSPTSYVPVTTTANTPPAPQFISPQQATTAPESGESVDAAQAVADTSPPQPARQLSTIMETTESTTQMSSSSERDSDSTSRTISRPGKCLNNVFIIFDYVVFILFQPDFSPTSLYSRPPIFQWLQNIHL